MNVNTTVFDVCVVGSGAAGGTLSSRLARQGLNVIVLEGGPRIDTHRAFNTHAMPYEFPNRKMPVMVPGVAGFEDERTRGVGGKTLLWNAVAWRQGPRDFKGYSLEGAGADWPIELLRFGPVSTTQLKEKLVFAAMPIIWKTCPMASFFHPCQCVARIASSSAAPPNSASA